jgi:hypothetical protein
MYMRDREVKMTTVLSAVLWTTGTLVVIAGMWTEVYGLPGVGLLLAGAGGVLSIRGFVLHCQDHLRDAFEYGRDFERGLIEPRTTNGTVRSLR